MAAVAAATAVAAWALLRRGWVRGGRRRPASRIQIETCGRPDAACSTSAGVPGWRRPVSEPVAACERPRHNLTVRMEMQRPEKCGHVWRFPMKSTPAAAMETAPP
eukprot:357440-Chlamydomonas_euryale.AAC.2